MSDGSLQMTVSADRVTGDMYVRFDRKPAHPTEHDLKNALKASGFSWVGFDDAAKWRAHRDQVDCFEDKVFKARVKAAVKGPGGGIAFYDLTGKCLGTDVAAYVAAVRAFDPGSNRQEVSA